MNRKNTVLIVILVAVLVLITACASGTPAVSGDSEETRTINVSGQGEAAAAPDVAYVSLGIDNRGGDLGEVIAAANTTMAEITEAVLAEGVEEKDIQTASFNVWVETPRDERGNPSGQEIYHVSNIIRITVRDIVTTGDVIGAALDAGANEVHSLSFGIDDTSELEAEARAAAVEDARARAEQLADGLGVTLGGPVSVSESYAAVPVPRADYAYAFAEAAGAPPIAEGELTVTVNVNVSFAIEN